ncbi:SCO family protein [Desulfobaculum senezii]
MHVFVRICATAAVCVCLAAAPAVAVDHGGMDHGAGGHAAEDMPGSHDGMTGAPAHDGGEHMMDGASGKPMDGHAPDHQSMPAGEHDGHMMPASEHDGHTMPAGNASDMHGNMTGDMADMPGHDHEAMMQEVMAEGEAVPDMDVGVDEKLGEYIPRGITLKDSNGHEVDLRDVLTAPSIIMPVYYTCPSVCNLMLSSFARILPDVALTPGQELRVVSISFDEYDTPKVAASKKRNYMASMQGEFPPEHWLYLTGDKQNIDRAMQAIGFRFHRVENAFVHAAVVVAVAPDGKIVRYLYGTDFLPFDVTMAATEAAQGKVGVSVKRLLSFCFDYDPEGRRYVFDTMRVAGFSILGFAVILFVILLVSGRKKRD